MRDSTRWEKVEEIHGHRFIRLKPGRRQKEGRLISYWDARNAADRADTDLVRAVSRCFKLISSDRELGGWDLENLEWFIHRVHEWIHAVEAEIKKRQGVQTVEERIALLRNVSGRSPEEAAAFTRKADELEERLNNA